MTPDMNDRIDVPEIVSEEECQSFIENGFLVVPNLLSDDEVKELRQGRCHTCTGRGMNVTT